MQDGTVDTDKTIVAHQAAKHYKDIFETRRHLRSDVEAA